MNLLVAIFGCSSVRNDWVNYGPPCEVQKAVAVVESPDPNAESFPYQYTPEKNLPGWQRVRMEGVGKLRQLWFAAPWFCKALYKKRSTTPEGVHYFKEQAKLLHDLGAQPLPAEHVSLNKLAMVGDLMWIQNGWDEFLGSDVKRRLGTYDLLLGNLESTIASSEPIPSFPVAFSFNSAPGLVTSFDRDDGTNMLTALSMANNHVRDHGDQALRETLELIDAEGIHQSGAQEKPIGKSYVTFERNGMTFGFFAATHGVNPKWRKEASGFDVNTVPGLAPELKGLGSREEAFAIIKCAGITEVLADMKRAKVDFKIISLHWGFEFEYYPSPKQMQVAREIVRAGADVIMGHGPHVQQPSEVIFVNGYEKTYANLAGSVPLPSPPRAALLESTVDESPRKALVMYSLGNFVSRNPTFANKIGAIADISVYKTREKQVDWALPGVSLTYSHNPCQWKGCVDLKLMRNYLQEENATPEQQRHVDCLLRHIGVPERVD